MRKFRYTASFVALLVACGGGGGLDDSGSNPLTDVGPIGVDYGQIDPGPPPEKCTADGDCPAATPWCNKIEGVCQECLSKTDCPGTGNCIDGRCDARMCENGSRTCLGTKIVVCADDGMTIAETISCGDQVCFQGQCMACKPGDMGCETATQSRRCRADGSGWDLEDCGEMKCAGGLCAFCMPGYKICQGSKVFRCSDMGQAFEEVEDCDTENTGKQCHLGMCIQLCEFNAKFKTNLGCEYWAIDMDQFDDGTEPNGANAPYAIVVSNTNESFKATVKVEKADGLVKTVEAPPQTATIIYLDPYNLVGPMKAKKSYRVTSNLPIVAYQFNPLENVDVYSNDASLLLPTNALGKKYLVMSWPTIGQNGANQMLSSNFTVVAAEAGGTKVKIVPTAKTLAGNGLASIAAGQVWETTLEQYEVLNIESAAVYSDLTGTTIDADKKVAVFGGNVCAMTPMSTCKAGKCSADPTVSCSTQDDCPPIAACDHVEEQLQPLAAWGDHYVVAKTQPRGKATDVIRILAAQDDTNVTVDPPVTTVPKLAAGKFHEFEILENVEIKADKPILVGQFLSGQNAPNAQHAACVFVDVMSGTGVPCEQSGSSGCQCYDDDNPFGGGSCTKQSDCSPNDANVGDPSFIISVPVEQFRKEYVFLVPTKYANNYISIVAEAGANVQVDGALLDPSAFTKVAGGTYVVARMGLKAGSHTLTSDKQAGLYVYGWDWYVSYGYPGGMNTETLSVWQ